MFRFQWVSFIPMLHLTILTLLSALPPPNKMLHCKLQGWKESFRKAFALLSVELMLADWVGPQGDRYQCKVIPGNKQMWQLHLWASWTRRK